MSLRDALLARFPRLSELPAGARIAVGGAVRDLLLGREPNDVDVEGDDPLALAQSLGRKIITLGRGELTVYRVVEGERIYDFSANSPLGRRDFTINAVAVDLATGEVLDPFDGRGDLDRRLLRMIDARNFDDDPLRLLRAVRFAVALGGTPAEAGATLIPAPIESPAQIGSPAQPDVAPASAGGFTIEENTLAAIRSRAPALASVSPERVTYELSLIFSASRFRRAVELLRETGLDVPLFGREIPVWRRRPRRRQPAKAPPRAAAPHHAAPHHAVRDRDDVSLAGAFALLVDDPPSFAERWRWSDSLLRDVLTLKRLARGRTLVDLYEAGEELARQLPAIVDEPVTMPDFSIRPLLDGTEIAAIAGIEPGPRVGALKRALIEAQLEGKVKTREEAEAFVRQHK